MIRKIVLAMCLALLVATVALWVPSYWATGCLDPRPSADQKIWYTVCLNSGAIAYREVDAIARNSDWTTRRFGAVPWLSIGGFRQYVGGRPGPAIAYRITQHHVHLSLFALLFAGYPLFAILHGRHVTVRRRRLGQCVTCGYDLRGNVSGRCPECGQPADAPPSPTT